MSTYYVTAAGFPAAIRAKMKRDRRKFIAAAHEGVNIGLRAAVAEVNRHGLVDRGYYKLAFTARRNVDGAELRNDVPYALDLEHGRAPGLPPPPFLAIRGWVARKLVPAGKVQPWNKAIDGAARAIRNAIHRRGTPPYRIFKTTRPIVFRGFRAAWKQRLTI